MIDIILGETSAPGSGDHPDDIVHDGALRNMANYFKLHFASPEDSFSALAYDPDTQTIHHVGKPLPQAVPTLDDK